MNTAGFLPGVVISFVADYIGQLYGRRWPIWIGSILAVSTTQPIYLKNADA